MEYWAFFSRPAVWSHWMSPHLNTAHTTWTFLTRTQSNFDLNDFKIPTFAKKKHKEANLRSQAVRSAVRVALCALLGTHFKTHTHTQQDGLFVLAVSVRFLSIRRWDEKFCNRAVSLAAPTDVRLLHHPVRPARFQPSRSTFIHTPTGAVQHKHPHPPRGVHWAETQYFLTNVSEKKRHTHTRGRVMCDWWSPQGKNAPNIMFKMKPERQKSRNLDWNYYFF